VFEFISKNFDGFDDLPGFDGESAVPAMISSLTTSWQFTTREQKKEIQDLFKLHENKLKGADNTKIVQRVYQELDANIEWMDNQGKDILSFFAVIYHLTEINMIEQNIVLIKRFKCP